MKMKHVFYLICKLIIVANYLNGQTIIPEPLEQKNGDNIFYYPKILKCSFTNELLEEFKMLKNLLKTDHNILLKKGNSTELNVMLILNERDSIKFGAEGYEINISKNNVQINSSTKAGIFYGIQSFNQLIFNVELDKFSVRQTYIFDKPRFSWRSYLLDDARYFQGTKTVKKLIDELSRLKINTFHWHLTDDHGWRIPIKKYPKLVEIGSKRDSTEIGGYWHSNIFDGKPHAGHYSIKEIKEILQYASERHIKIIPEIEMPGHATAAIASYPWLGTSGKNVKVSTSFGVKFDTFDISNPKVIQFLEDVLTEIIKIFNSPVIHIGGDEVRYDQWLASENVLKFMQEHQIKSAADLQIDFVNKISNFLNKKNVRMMGWNDILGSKIHDYNDSKQIANSKLAPNTIIQFWKGDPKLMVEAINNGYEIVNSYHEYTYLDYDYKTISLEKAYSFEPIPEGLNKELEKKIIGIGTQMWGAWTPNSKEIYLQTFPRIAAYAEIGWSSKENKNLLKFLQKLEKQKIYWKTRNIQFH